MTVSTAFHKLQQLEVDHGALDYALLSPIFNSISKTGYKAAFEMDELSQCISRCNIPLVALGGEPCFRDTRGLATLLTCCKFACRSVINAHSKHACIIDQHTALIMPAHAVAGIAVANILQVKQLGFSGAGVLGSVWSSTDPVAACEELLTACASV